MSGFRRGGGTATYHAIMAWSASIVVHVVMASFGAILASAQSTHPLAFRASVIRRAAPFELSIELPLLSSEDAHAGGALLDEDAQQPAMGGEHTPRPDTGRAGRGGDATAREAAINLAARDDEAHLTPLLQSRMERAQHARHREGRGRQSPEDDTANERPMILTLFVDGDGQRFEQRPAAARDPSRGSYLAGAPMQPGGVLFGAQSLGVGLPRHRGLAGESALDGEAVAGNGHYQGLGGGVLDSWWSDQSGYAADVTFARPFAQRGLVASSADRRGPHQDNVDAEQEDMTPERDLLHASGAGGPVGDGRGGEAGPGPTGSGGKKGAGSRSRALGTGVGDGVGVDAADRRRAIYRRQVWAKIHGAWNSRDFPKQAVLEGKQGFTIVSFTVLRGGTVTGVRTVRSSGFPSFDAKMRAAVFRAAPFGPLPSELGATLPLTHQFIVSNAAVR